MRKTRVAVLRGGPSDEYTVSMHTGQAVLDALRDHDRFDPLDITISKTGEWLHHGRTRYPEHLIPAVDVVFIALHGAYGEDGTVQRLLDRFGVPYTGSGAYSSGIAMHKALTKEHLTDVDCAFAKHAVVNRSANMDGRAHASDIRGRFGPHYVIKPTCSGSSVGVTIIKDTLELGPAIDVALETFEEIIIEEYIDGIEVTCGVVERFRNRALYALPPILIVPPPSATFFDATVKYDGTTKEICPAPIPRSQIEHIESLSGQIHRALHLRQYSRSDFIVTPKGEVYFLEVNTLPGLTTESLMPKALSAVGAPYRVFIEHLISDALSA